MKPLRHGQPIDITSTQSNELARRPLHSHRPAQGSQIPSELVAQWIGPRMPARRAAPPMAMSAFPQMPPAEVLELTQLREEHRQQNMPAPAPRSKNAEILELLEEWTREPDDLGDEWWEQFDKDLKANRFRFPKRDLP